MSKFHQPVESTFPFKVLVSHVNLHPYIQVDDSDGDSDGDDDDDEAAGSLVRFDMRRLKRSVLVDSGVVSVSLSLDRRCMTVELRNLGSD